MNNQRQPKKVVVKIGFSKADLEAIDKLAVLKTEEDGEYWSRGAIVRDAVRRSLDGTAPQYSPGGSYVNDEILRLAAYLTGIGQEELLRIHTPTRPTPIRAEKEAEDKPSTTRADEAECYALASREGSA